MVDERGKPWETDRCVRATRSGAEGKKKDLEARARSMLEL